MSDNAAFDLNEGSFLFPNGLPKRTKKNEIKLASKPVLRKVPTLRTVPNEETTEWFWGIGHSLQDLKADLQLSLKSSLNVLIVGETGTGKELLARKLHNERRRLELLSEDEAPFVSVNCSTIPESLAESILFGHERGAFTSARDKQIGKFQLAKQGTLFLDEVQSLPLEVQVKLLRVLQQREVERLGGKKPYKIECKIIAATNIPLEILVEQKKFRKDLYYRLNICPLYIPAVRHRLEDFPVLLKGLLEKVCRESRCDVPEVSSNAFQLLMSHPWPGNLREIEHALMFALMRSTVEIDVEHLPPSITGKLSHYLATGDWV
jgi:transcriptional regulator with PAS, ATPase and Fis domain